MDRDSVLYLLQNHISIKSLLTTWARTCKTLHKRITTNPSFIINHRLSVFSKKFPIIELYLKRNKTRELLFKQPFKFLFQCEVLERHLNTYHQAVKFLQRISNSITEHHGDPNRIIPLLNAADNANVLVPPDYAHFFTLCEMTSFNNTGLTLYGNSAATTPSTGRRYGYSNEGLLCFATLGYYFDDMAHFYLVVDPHSPWYGRFAYYMEYQDQGKLRVLDKHWYFGDVLQILMNSEQMFQDRRDFSHVIAAQNIELAWDYYGILEKPLDYNWDELYFQFADGSNLAL